MSKILPSSCLLHIAAYKNWKPWSGKTYDRKDYYIDNISTTIQDIVASCPSEYEVALHSDVYCNARKFHIPQMDFAMLSQEITQNIRDYLAIYLKEIGIQQTDIFSSGRSFHGYGHTLLTQEQRHIFLWKLLTAFPQENTKRIFDSRRIGHSLIQWSSSIRLTKNTDAYNALPSYYKTI